MAITSKMRVAFRKEKHVEEHEDNNEQLPSDDNQTEELVEMDEAELYRLQAERAAKEETEALAKHARAHALSIMAKHLFEEAVKQRLMSQIGKSEAKLEKENHSSSSSASVVSPTQSVSSCSQGKVDATVNLQSVALRIVKGDYSCWPATEEVSLSWITSLSILNVGAAMTVRSTATSGIIDLLAEDAQEVVLSASSRIQVLQNVGGLARARKAQGVAFIRSMRCMVVWSDKASQLIQEAQQHHNRVLKFLWKVVDPDSEYDGAQPETPSVHLGNQSSQIPESPSSYFQFIPSSTSFRGLNEEYLGKSASPGQSVLDSPFTGADSPKSSFYRGGIFPSSSSHGHLVLGKGRKKTDISPSNSSSSGMPLTTSNSMQEMHSAWNNGSDIITDEKVRGQEEGNTLSEDIDRPMVKLSCIQHGLAAGLAFLLAMLGPKQALEKTLLDHDWSRLGLFAVMPFTFFLCMFFCDSIIQFFLMMFGPVRQLQENTRYYSGKRPAPLLMHEVEQLPHITIQMPVYKESLEGVLKGSFESVKKAIQTYELQGGSASIIVSEDGYLLVDEEERQARLAYYEENNITWIARPKHGDQGFVRPGRFKKASNLNFTYEVMRRVELRMQTDLPHLFHPTTGKPIASNNEERASWQHYYNDTMQKVLTEIHPTATGSGVDQIGDFILMIDSDTRIPVDCFMDAAAEMTRCKDVGVLQHCSGVMKVSTSFFESCIAYFTRLVNFAITLAVANGDIAPFMGHNAYLRWSAMQEIAREEVDEKGLVSYKIWSDEHVSEDFVMALDMLSKGYIVRWATYDNAGYIEGVSLTCTDELNRWQKYAWGVSEMIFRPLKHWYKGPFTPLIRRFWSGNLPIHYKWAATSYCFSYYAIAVSLPLSVVITLVKGWFNDTAAGLYSTNFQNLISILFVFWVAGSLGIVTIGYRAGRGSWFKLAKENLMHLPFMAAFFGGLSYHVSTALLSHILGINMTWGATLKDIEQTTVWAEVPALLKRFWKTFVLCLTILAGMITLTFSFIPVQYQLYSVYDVFPVCFVCMTHILYPIILNPNLLHFSF